MAAASSDREFLLNAEIVRELIGTQFPALHVTSVGYLDEGWDSAAYLVNGEWIFRFPKRREREAWLRSELAVLQLLGTKRLPVEVPAPIYFGQPAALFPCGCMGYRMISGTRGDEFPIGRVDHKHLAGQLGAAGDSAFDQR